MTIHPDVAAFLATAHATAQAEVMDHPHVLVSIDPEDPFHPTAAIGVIGGALEALARAVEWQDELNGGGILGPADPPFVVVAVPLYPDPGPRPPG